MIKITAQLTFEDHQRAWRYNWRLQTYLLAGIFGAMTLFVWIINGNILPLIFVAIYFLLARPLYYRIRNKRNWKKTPSAHRGEITMGLDEKGVHLEDDEGNPSVVYWDKFLKYGESKHSFLLNLSPSSFLVLPKRVISTENQVAIRELLRTNLHTKGKST